MIQNFNKSRVDFGVLHTFKYPIINSLEDPQIIGHIPVSTTRIETMLGDAAVAIHPDDDRYKHFHNKFILHPFHPTRSIPIVLDAQLVDPTFGTGAVKITPAHDHNDFECGRRHKLEFINIMNRNGTLNENSGLNGMNRFEARDYVITKLQELDLYVGMENHQMDVPVCSRSGDVIEPLLIPQWFVKCDVLVDKILQNDTTIYPESHRIIWKRWLEGIHDWCISRQLWWGHRVPAYKLIIEG
jgi:valyl-tRNA synthetase